VCTGWAHWEFAGIEKPGQKEKLELKKYGVLKPVGDVSSKRLVLFESMLKTLIYEVCPTVVVVEDLNYTRNMDIVKVLGAFLGTAKKLAYEFNKVEPIQLPRTTVLKTVLGKGNAEKSDVIGYVNAHILNEPIPTDDKTSEDIADAIVTGYCYILSLKSNGDGNG
jgi:Holliday junction resolvasome RuvABC endonuclease subunit